MACNVPDEDFEAFMSPVVGRRLYLVTYSDAKENIFPTRESFGRAAQAEFDAGSSKAKVDYLAVCREPHKDPSKFHYHAAVKLTACKKWIGVKKRLSTKHGIEVNFSASHDLYATMYDYLTKTDNLLHMYHSEGHPSPKNILSQISPRTKTANKANRKRNAEKRRSAAASASASASASSSCSQSKGPPEKKKRFSNSTASEYIYKNQIHDYTELLAAAHREKEGGEPHLFEFVFNKNQSNLSELISKTWQMAEANRVIAQRNAKRMDTIREKSQLQTCEVEACNGLWLRLALEVLQLNGIDVNFYSACLRNALTNGRGKHRNVILCGPSNCAKTFLLKPLRTLFGDKVFENPSNHKFAWMGAETAQVIFLNDFRWNREIITWDNLLRLLEGDIVKLPAAKNIQAEDVVIKSDVAIFATSKQPIQYKGTYNTTCTVEDRMMESRWKKFEFRHVFVEEDQVEAEPCGKCFATLCLVGTETQN